MNIAEQFPNVIILVHICVVVVSWKSDSGRRKKKEADITHNLKIRTGHQTCRSATVDG